MRNQVFKKLFSVLLALIMVAGLLPASVLAEVAGRLRSSSTSSAARVSAGGGGRQCGFYARAYGSSATDGIG